MFRDMDREGNERITTEEIIDYLAEKNLKLNGKRSFAPETGENDSKR